MKIRTGFLAALILSASCAAGAAGLDSITSSEASSGVKAALEKGADVAVSRLGVANGFLGNEKVKIPLPDGLRQSESVMRMMGMGSQADALVEAMNHAAEEAVSHAKPMLVNAVHQMTVSDAKKILTGGDTSVTDFFREKTQASLTKQFLPTVKKATDKQGLAQKYNQLASKVSQFGVVKPEDATIEQYVTRKALDGLYTLIGEEEKNIRRDPVGAGSQVISKVFGLLK
jgi:hypothetical protein